MACTSAAALAACPSTLSWISHKSTLHNTYDCGGLVCVPCDRTLVPVATTDSTVWEPFTDRNEEEIPGLESLYPTEPIDELEPLFNQLLRIYAWMDKTRSERALKLREGIRQERKEEDRAGWERTNECGVRESDGYGEIHQQKTEVENEQIQNCRDIWTSQCHVDISDLAWRHELSMEQAKTAFDQGLQQTLALIEGFEMASKTCGKVFDLSIRMEEKYDTKRRQQDLKWIKWKIDQWRVQHATARRRLVPHLKDYVGMGVDRLHGFF